MSPGAWVVLAAVAVAAAFGGWRLVVDGRFRRRDVVPPAVAHHEPEAEPDGVLAGTPWADDLGERATLLQFSSAFCAPCRATRVVLAAVAADEPGVRHLEVDAEQHLDVVRRLKVMRTPTTIVLDPAGRELGRAAGAPTREQVLRALPAR
jgi:thiol-disulfide isomerase/thioredoxin